VQGVERCLSDRVRPVVALMSALGALALMMWWGMGTAAGEIGAVRVLDRPPGTSVVLSLLTVLSIDGPDQYVLGHAALRIPVVGPTAERVVGEEITIGGVVEEGRVRELWAETAPGRPEKRRLGLLGLAAAAALLGSAVRVERGGLALRG
jgi:hypothetical protein